MGSRSIANKYHEGKVKRTLRRELKVLEIAHSERIGTIVSKQHTLRLVGNCWSCPVLLDGQDRFFRDHRSVGEVRFDRKRCLNT